jgi:hypothetical protein
MNFQEFKANYLKVNEVQEYPSSKFVEDYVNAGMKDAIGTETQLKDKRNKLNEKAKKLHSKMVVKHSQQYAAIEKAYIDDIISEYQNKELAEKIFNKLLINFDDYDRLDKARDILYNFSDIIETYKPV